MRTTLLIGALVLLVGTVASASFFDNFDSYLNGQALDGTPDDGGWKGWDNTPAAGGTVTNLLSLSPENSVQVAGPTDLVHEFNETGAGFVFSIQQFIPSGTIGTTYFILLNTYKDGGPDSWSTQVPFNLVAGTVAADQPGGGATLPIVFDRWMEIRVVADFATNTQSVYYGGALLSSGAWTDANGQLALQAVDLFANGADAVYYDDIGVVPEPSSLFALAGFLPGLAFLRRRK